MTWNGSNSSRRRALLGPEDLASDVLVRDVKGLVEPLDDVFGGLEVRDEVVALVLMIDLIGESADAPTLDARDLAAPADEGGF